MEKASLDERINIIIMQGYAVIESYVRKDEVLSFFSQLKTEVLLRIQAVDEGSTTKVTLKTDNVRNIHSHFSLQIYLPTLIC